MRGTSMLRHALMKEQGWSCAKTDLVISQYEWFMQQKIRLEDWNSTKISPSWPVELAWRAHILDTASYRNSWEITHFIDYRNPLLLSPEGGEFARAQRYFCTFGLLTQEQKDMTDVWPRPRLYVWVTGPDRNVNPLFELSEKKSSAGDVWKYVQKHRRDNVKVEFFQLNNVIADSADFRQQVTPFSRARWWSVPKKKSRKRTRAQQEKKVIQVKAISGVVKQVEIDTLGTTCGDLKLVVDRLFQFRGLDRFKLAYASNAMKDEQSLDHVGEGEVVNVIYAL